MLTVACLSSVLGASFMPSATAATECLAKEAVELAKVTEEPDKVIEESVKIEVDLDKVTEENEKI